MASIFNKPKPPPLPEPPPPPATTPQEPVEAGEASMRSARRRKGFRSTLLAGENEPGDQMGGKSRLLGG